jgi:hypothetical protein
LPRNITNGSSQEEFKLIVNNQTINSASDRLISIDIEVIANNQEILSS